MIEDEITSLGMIENQAPLTKKEKKRASDMAYRKANHERVKAVNAAYQKANAGQIKAQKIGYYKANAAKAKSNAYAWAKANPEKRKEICAAYRKANPEKGRESNHKRRALKRGATIGDLQEIRDWINGWRKSKVVQCYWCNAKIKAKDAHADHILPLKKGGHHALGNLCVACPKCNLTKNAKLPEVWNAQLTQPLLLL